MACLFLTSCADFADTPGKSVWSEGLWIIPWVSGLGSAWFSFSWAKDYIAYKKYPGYKKYKGYGYLIYGAALLVATIVISIVQTGAK